MTIMVSAGHHPTKPGACFGSFCEWDEAKIWADRVVALLDGLAMRVPDGVLKDKVGFINARSPTLAIEIHFNSYKIWEDLNKDGQVSDDELRAAGRGSETLYYPGSHAGKKLATIVQAALALHFPPSRGVKEGYYRMDPANGPDFFLARTKCPSVIVEPEFIHRTDLITTKRDAACAGIACALLDFTELGE